MNISLNYYQFTISNASALLPEAHLRAVADIITIIIVLPLVAFALRLKMLM
jgi:hypothetical protein